MATAARGEAVRYTEIAQRDGWVCYLCDGDVDVTVGYPDPFSGSLDHVVPLAKGGAHLASNVRLAHLRCNVRKGTKGPALLKTG